MTKAPTIMFQPLKSPARTLAGSRSLVTVGTLLTVAVLACAASAVYAASPPDVNASGTGPTSQLGATSEVGAQALAARLKQQQPNTRIDSVRPSPVPGLYEVVMGRNVAYVEPGGRYAVFGNVWDLEQGRDLTSQRKAALDRIDPTSLPTELALRTVHGDGTRVVHVFADPMCGYCRQLERTLPALTNTTVYTHLLPVLGDESKALSADIWCSADRAGAWSEWMLNDRRPPAASAACAGQFAEASVTVQRIAASAGIQATPTLVSADGRKHAGALALPQLQAWLGSAASALARQPTPGTGSSGVASTRKTATNVGAQ